MPLSREDLALSHYEWNPSSADNLYQGSPSRRRFDRYNGPQVLFILNLFCQQTNNYSPELCRTLENLLIHQMPLEIQSEVSVLKWLSAQVIE